MPGVISRGNVEVLERIMDRISNHFAAKNALDLHDFTTYGLFQFGSHRLDSYYIHKIKSENL